jgi:hypothetical protein
MTDDLRPAPGSTPGGTRKPQPHPDTTECRYAYYSVLHQDPRFEEELQTLCKLKYPLLSRSPSPEETLAALNRQWDTPADIERAGAFARRWHLPQFHDFELWVTLYLAPYGFRPRLRPFRDYLSLGLGNVHPLRIPSFPFNPNQRQAALVNRLTAQFRKDLSEQMDELQRHARTRWRPPHSRKRAELRQMATRLYLRAVRRQRWADIARAEGPGVTEHAVRTSVTEWARLLNVELPPSRIGRPPKKK